MLQPQLSKPTLVLSSKLSERGLLVYKAPKAASCLKLLTLWWRTNTLQRSTVVLQVLRKMLVSALWNNITVQVTENSNLGWCFQRSCVCTVLRSATGIIIYLHWASDGFYALYWHVSFYSLCSFGSDRCDRLSTIRKQRIKYTKIETTNTTCVWTRYTR